MAAAFGASGHGNIDDTEIAFVSSLTKIHVHGVLVRSFDLCFLSLAGKGAPDAFQ